MSQPPRRSRGFRQASSLVAEPIRHAAEGRGFAVARLLTHWAEVVGPETASRARPVKISHTRNGMGATLTLLTTGPYAPLLEMQLPALRDRVNACYGYNAISRITLTQTAPTGFSEGQASFDHAPKARPQPDAETRRAAQALAAQISDPALQAAVARLAALKLTRKGRANRKVPE
ncbi:DUF721 domain-containing protein [Paracoccus xiamenensis]|uniref:DUF721 domain-containing protein n=1 Tax=Paracoccus xiamenensis TaxID=2714901 RepID=UPI00140C5C1E|nr:DUF721 domain-containing protein [Paracoccus xiamenensis]NHF73045.1 DUF721 domain-containing protein [Paracoccus xiamenensis]